MAAYYNEIDPKAAQWLRNLIAAGLIAPGDVDERSIKDVQPHELAGYTQCHFFAGIGVWSYALRSAGWPDDRPVWTGSCPCQPFSAAGKGEGLDDPRHLWPDWFRLIRERGPVVVFGEQVAGPDGVAWLDLAQADLEEHSHTVGAVVTCSAGFGGPDIRQRLYWVADAGGGGVRDEGCGQLDGSAREVRGEIREQRLRPDDGASRALGGMATPKTATGGANSKREERGAGGPDLQEAVKLAGWQTPTVNDSKGSDYSYSNGDHDRPFLKLPGEAKLAGWLSPTANEDAAGNWGAKMQPMLGSQVKLAGWAAPMAGSKATEEYNEAGNTDSSRKTVMLLAGWPTPDTMDGPHGARGVSTNPKHQSAKSLEAIARTAGPARLTVSGDLLTGSSARMESGGQLNPAHSRWIQGLPAAWCDCAPTATRSTRKPRASSSKRTST